MFNKKMQLNKINDDYKCKIFDLICHYSQSYDFYFSSGPNGFSVLAYDKGDTEKSYTIIKYDGDALKIHTLVSIMAKSQDFRKLYDYIRKAGIVICKLPLDHLIKLAVASKLV